MVDDSSDLGLAFPFGAVARTSGVTVLAVRTVDGARS